LQTCANRVDHGYDLKYTSKIDKLPRFLSLSNVIVVIRIEL